MRVHDMVADGCLLIYLTWSSARQVKDLWLLYEVSFAFYMLEPMEKVALHITLAAILGMAMYTT